MKNQKLLTSIAALCAAMYVTTSFAQEAGVNADAEVSAETSTDGIGGALEGAADTADGLGNVVEETVPADSEAEGEMTAEGSAEAETDSGAEAETSTEAGADATSSTDAAAETDTEAETSADANAKLNLGMLISSLKSGEAAIDLSTVDEATVIKAVKLSEFQGGAAEKAQALDNALTENQDQITALQDAVAANGDISALLETEGLAAENVIAVMSATEGSVQVVVDDRDDS